MPSFPESVTAAWDNREEPYVFSTVDKKGNPNSIYVTCAKLNDNKIVIADNKFQKTRQNLLNGSSGSFLFITKEGKSFQIKGTLEYQKSGKLYDEMKQGWLAPKYPGNAATVLHVEEVYSGAEKLL
jgi:predicted pyridoxine 5'-phosphate oxidase superfamily flavin-nucleotide-binding protein